MVFVTCWHLNLYDCDHVLLYLVLLSRTSFLSNRLFLLTLLPSRLCWLFGQILCIVRFLRLFLSRGFFDGLLFSFSLFSLLPLVLLLLCSGRLEEEHTYLTLASKNCWQQKIVLKKKKKRRKIISYLSSPLSSSSPPAAASSAPCLLHPGPCISL